MLLWPSPREGLAWLEAGDETWAGYADARYAAAVAAAATAAERGQDDDPEPDR